MVPYFFHFLCLPQLQSLLSALYSSELPLGVWLITQINIEKRILGPTPLIGGLAIFICVTIFQLVDPGYPQTETLALFAIVMVGVIDDKNNLPALTKLALQFLAAALAVFGGGVKIVSLGSLPGGSELLLGWLSIPVTMICIVGMINAVNMIDGIDGLAAGLKHSGTDISLFCRQHYWQAG